jgi:hypothetical protein
MLRKIIEVLISSSNVILHFVLNINHDLDAIIC